MAKESLFKRLYKQKDILENFITEAFAGVLKSLLRNEQLDLFFDELKISGIEFRNPSISTQKRHFSVRNDLVIVDDHLTIIFENKWDSPTDMEQLKKYDEYLTKIEKDQKYLIHLTKDYEIIEDIFKTKFCKITWGDIYLDLKKINNSYITQEFLRYLEEERIAMEKVSWEIINGARPIFNLTRIIERASRELNLTHKWESGGSLEPYVAQTIEGKLCIYFLIREGKLYFSVFNY